MPAAQKTPPKPQKPPSAAKPLKKGDHLFLVDGSGYIFRAYHALPPINRKSDGLQLNAVFGFCNMLWKLLRDMKAEDKPSHLAVVFDKSEKTFRTAMYPGKERRRGKFAGFVFSLTPFGTTPGFRFRGLTAKLLHPMVMFLFRARSGVFLRQTFLREHPLPFWQRSERQDVWQAKPSQAEGRRREAAPHRSPRRVVTATLAM